MRVIPVLDLMNGVVVRGVAGRRSEYRPIDSRLSASAEPLAVARAFREHFGLTELYVADLDAIGGREPPHPSPLPPWGRRGNDGEPAWAVYEQLLTDGFLLLVDAGVADVERGRRLAQCGVTVIAALETIPGPRVLDTLLRALGPERLVFSLDLKSSEPLARDPGAWQPIGREKLGSEWQLCRRAKPFRAGVEDPGLKPGFCATAMHIVERTLAAGVRRLIVLDLASVGVGDGIPTLDLCHAIRQARQTRTSVLHPPHGGETASGEAACVPRTLPARWDDLEIITGGGVRSRDDLRLAADAGIDAALVASALHDGRLTRIDVQQHAARPAER